MTAASDYEKEDAGDGKILSVLFESEEFLLFKLTNLIEKENVSKI
jgi:hypothetical protein